MGWPITQSSFEDDEDLFFDFTPEELGLDKATAAKIESIRRLRPLSAKQPFGIFFIKFEPKRLPVVALRRILSSVALKKRASANSSERAAWKADDLLFISNFGQGDQRQITFAHFSQNEQKDDLPTLKVLGWDNRDTALHLDSVAKELTENLRWPVNEDDQTSWRNGWRSAFTVPRDSVITKSKDLSLRLAELARAIRDRINTVLKIETEHGPVTKLMKAFQEVLIHDLDADGFADMYAQTITYGLLSARITDPHKKTADDFAGHMRTNPFLRELMETFLQVGGRRGRNGGPGIDFDELGVSEVVELLDDTNMEAVVRDFGDLNPQEDPVIHFYVLFLKEYDAKKRMQRGVFYTPRPVVSYIVRSIHELLQTEFGLTDGLADTATWGDMAQRFSGLNFPEGVKPTDRFVTVLDVATGTGTFLVVVIEVIYNTLVEKWKREGYDEKRILDLWNDYVPKHLLPRLYGYELLMAPYAIAHLKVGLKLHETGYRFESNERAHIYLTNTLEPASDMRQMKLAGILPALAHEAQAVNEVKRSQRFTVVIGNPPYSNFGQLNRIPFILDLLEDYKRGLNERKLNLDDDFIKFIRFAQWSILEANVGVVGFISNNTYIDGLTHRRMRQSLAESFCKICVLDLHGSVVKAERGPEGDDEENVFDIQQGVAIGLFTRLSKSVGCRVEHADLWGTRERKYAFLMSHSVQSISWRPVACDNPNYFFVPKSFGEGTEYQNFLSLPMLMQRGTSAIQTKRDALFVDFERDALAERMKEVLRNGPTRQMLERYPLAESGGWSAECLRGVAFDPKMIRPYLYRPFDKRFIYYDDALLGRSRFAVFRHLLRPNLALATLRQTVDDAYRHVFCTTNLCDINLTIGHHVSDQVFPLYLYADSQRDVLGKKRTANISQVAVQRLCSLLGVEWTGDGRGDLAKTIGPEDAFDYVYSVLHSPKYRNRYKEFLKIDFPRLPLPGSLDPFRDLAGLGGEIVALHLMESPKLDHFITTYTGPKNPEVERVGWSDDTVWLDAAATKKGQPATPGTIGFHGVPEAVWNFHIGGYQVCEKWLKDRKGRTLSKDDITHYQKIVVALSETIRIMKEIDEVIEKHGGWPGAFNTTPSVPSRSVLVPTTADASKVVTEYAESEEPLPLAAEAGLPFGDEHQPITVDLGQDGDSPPLPRKSKTKGNDESDSLDIDEIDQSEIMAAIRQVLSDGVARERDAAVRDVARELGFDRTGNRIQERLNGELIAAARRGIIANKGGELSMAARTIDDYGRDYLKTLFLSDMGSTWWDREDAINRAARYLGFTRTRPRIYDSFKSIINGLIRDGKLESDTAKGIRRI